jgi:hypothetical protein
MIQASSDQHFLAGCIIWNTLAKAMPWEFTTV